MREKLEDKKHIIIIIIFAIGICLACILGMLRPGIHFIPGFMHADVEKNCYIYDDANNEFLGETKVVIKGWGNNITKKFRGEMSVDGYEVEGEPFSPAGIFRGGSLWSAQYRGVAYTTKKDEDGIEHTALDFSDISYNLWLDVRDSENFIIVVGKVLNAGEENSSTDLPYIIGAGSKEKAKEVYRSIVMEQMPGLMADNDKGAVFTGVAVFIIIIGIVCVLWMRRPGIHFLLCFMYADVKRKCYFYNAREGKISGKAEVFAKGWHNGITKRFHGKISFAGYEGKEAGDTDGFSVIFGTEYQNSKIKYQYWIYMDAKNNNKFIVRLGDNAGNHVYAICAGTEWEAKDRFMKFWNNK